MIKTLGLIATYLLILSSCSYMKGDDEHTIVLEKHILTGKIWDVKGSQFVDKQKVIEEKEYKSLLVE